MIKNKEKKQDAFSILPELDITLDQLQQHVAQEQPKKNSVLRYSSLGIMLLCIIGSYLIFGNSTTPEEKIAKNFTVQEVHPLMLPFIETKPNATGKPVYEVLFSDKGTAFFKNIDSL